MILIALLFFLTIIGIAIVVSRLIYKWLREKWNQKIALIGLSLVWGIFFYNIYYAIYPDNSFYEKEFEMVTALKIPKSAEIVMSSASYPDFHGDYCSSAQIKLSKEDFSILLNKLKNDKRFQIQANPIIFDEFVYTFENKKAKDIIISLERNDSEIDEFFVIKFYNDNQTIFINVCKT